MNKFFLIIGIVFVGIIVSGCVSPEPPVSKYDDLAKCMTEKGTIFYGAFWCHNCTDQKNLFGSAIQHINYIECSTPDGKGQLEVCQLAGIEGYPTWKFADGTLRSGVITLPVLADRTGCEMPK